MNFNSCIGFSIGQLARKSIYLFMLLIAFSLAAAAPVFAVNDYPYANSCTEFTSSCVDPWGFYYRQCTSYVAWRMNRDAGTTESPYSFHNYMEADNYVDPNRWSNAGHWGQHGQDLGIEVNNTPAVGAVAHWGYDEVGGGYGHVAYVESVNADGSANISEYNYASGYGYGTRNNISAPRYIHVNRETGGIVISSPSDGDQWAMFTPHNIKWTPTGTSNILIHLYRNGQFVQSIDASTSNDGDYEWKVFEWMEPGDGYYVAMSDGSKYGESARFTISNGVRVESPNGGEKFNIGDQVTVKWTRFPVNTSQGLPYVNIHLYKGGTDNFYLSLSSPESNSGSYIWNVKNVEPGNDYYLAVSGDSDGGRSWDFSNTPFTVLQTSLPPDLDLSSSTVPSTAHQSGGNYSVRVNNKGDETLSWNKQSVPYWVTVSSPVSISGGSYQTVQITVSQNTDTDSRNCNIKFYNTQNSSDYEYLSISQEGLAPSKPTITTAAVTSVTSSAATCGGNVTSDGGSSVTVKGVCWNTTGNPIVNDNRSVDSDGTGSFISSVSALNPGITYYVRAYATNNAGTAYGDQKTFTTLTTTCTPDWEPVVYTNTTTAYGIVTIDGEPAAEGDIVGVFAGEECRGVGNVFVYDDKSYVTLVIQGETTETVSFKVYDVSECDIIDVRYTTQTVPGGVLGNPAADDYIPISASISVTQDIPLDSGWNLISLNVHPENMAPSSVFNPIITNIVQVKSSSESYDPTVPEQFNTLTEIRDGYGYWVRVNQNDQLDVTGSVTDVSATAIQLDTGWNLVGYICQQQQPVTDALASIMSALVQVKSTDKTYEPNIPDQFNTLTHLEQGKGYWIKVSSPATLHYSEPVARSFARKSYNSGSEKVLRSESLPDWKPVIYTNSTTAYGIVTIDGEPAAEGDIAGAFVGEECRGVGDVFLYNGNSYVSLVIQGEKPETVAFRIYDVSEGAFLDVNYTTQTNPGESLGNPSADDYIAIAAITQQDIILAPTNLKALSGKDSVKLKWVPSTSAYLAGYNVYRSLTSDSGFARVNTGLVTGDYYTDNSDLANGSTYYYYMTALDSSGKESDPSDTASAVFGQVKLFIPDSKGKSGTQVILPVNIANADGLEMCTVDIYVSYDPNVLKAKDITKSSLSADYGWAKRIDNDTGVIQAAIASGIEGEMLYGEGSLFYVVFDVVGNPGDTSELKFDINDTGFYDCNDFINSVDLDLSDAGIFTVLDEGQNPGDCGFLGDLNMDCVVNADDMAMALEFAVGNILITAKLLNIGDISGDGRIKSNDAALIERIWQGLPLAPESSKTRRKAMSSSLIVSVPGNVAVPGEGSVWVPIEISNAADVTGADIVLNYDPSLVTVSGVRSGLLTANFDVKYNVVQAGQVRISIGTGEDDALTGGSGTLAEVRFTAKSDSSGTSPLMLASVHLNDSFSRDFATSALQVDVKMSNGSLVVKNYDLSDAIRALKVIAGLNVTDISSGDDIDGDGKVGLEEVVYVLQVVSEIRH